MKTKILSLIAFCFLCSCTMVYEVQSIGPNPEVTSHGEFEDVILMDDGYEYVERYYFVSTANTGDESAYGLVANLEIRSERPHPYDRYSTVVEYYSVPVYITDELRPGWEVEVSYLLDWNEDVVHFEGIQWEEAVSYASLQKPGAKNSNTATLNGKPRVKVTLKEPKE